MVGEGEGLGRMGGLALGIDEWSMADIQTSTRVFCMAVLRCRCSISCVVFHASIPCSSGPSAVLSR